MTCFKYYSQDLPTVVFPDIFTTNLLCLIRCPNHEWHGFFKILKSGSSFERLHQSLFCLPILNILLQHHVSNAFMTLSSFFPRVHVSDPYRATLQIQLFYFQTRVIRSSCFLLWNTTLACLSCVVIFIFSIFCEYTAYCSSYMWKILSQHNGCFLLNVYATATEGKKNTASHNPPLTRFICTLLHSVVLTNPTRAYMRQLCYHQPCYEYTAEQNA
jgi:hypothetical protein